MKKLLSVVICLLLAAALTIPAFAAESVSFSMSASKSTAYRGDSITLNVSVASDADATSYGLKLSYDAAVFEEVPNSGACSVPGALVSSYKNGFAFMFTNATAYSGQVGSVTLKVKDDAPVGTYTISGTASVKNGSNTVSAAGGVVTIEVTCDHNYSAWTGNAEGHERVCADCGNVEKAAHTWDAGVINKEANCKEEGQKTYTCTVCGALNAETIEKTDDHVFGNLTSVDGETHKDTCSVCEKEIIEAHTWNDGEITKEANCKEEGEKTFTCTGCAATKTEAIAKTEDHVFGNLTAVDENNHKDVCSVCGEEITEAHTWDEGVATVPATCVAEGEMTYTCTGCGQTKTEVAPIDAEAHAYGEWVVTVEPTKESKGSRERVCTLCEHKEVEELPAISSPATGDNSQMILWMTIMALSVCGLMVAVFVIPARKGKFER